MCSWHSFVVKYLKIFVWTSSTTKKFIMLTIQATNSSIQKKRVEYVNFFFNAIATQNSTTTRLFDVLTFMNFDDIFFRIFDRIVDQNDNINSKQNTTCCAKKYCKNDIFIVTLKIKCFAWNKRNQYKKKTKCDASTTNFATKTSRDFVKQFFSLKFANTSKFLHNESQSYTIKSIFCVYFSSNIVNVVDIYVILCTSLQLKSSIF